LAYVWIAPYARPGGYRAYVLTDVTGWPSWVVLAVFALGSLTVMFGARFLLSRHSDADRREELSGLAGSLNGPVGATLAFLVGFAVSITWTTMSSAQSSVEKLAAQAQQTALLVGSTLAPVDDERISTDMVAYLQAIADRDSVVLAQEEVTEMPSFAALEKLQNDVHDLERNAADGADTTSLRTLQSGVLQMAQFQAELNAVARRGLPPVVLQLLIATGCLSAATVGLLAVNVRRPYLIVGWAVVIAMGLTVVIALYNPFEGSVAVTFDPLLDAAQRIGTR
jgi:hypothetical protein